MCRKIICLFSLVMVLGLTASASAANDIVWTNADESNSSWCNGDNWDGDTQPGSSDTAWINQIPQTPESGNPTVYSPNRGPVVPIGCSPTVGYIEGPDPCFGNIQVMDINTDGTFYIKNDWTWQGGVGTAIININGTADVDIDGVWRGTDNGISIINIDDNPTITVGGDFRAADESGELYFNMSGGYFNVQGEFLLGDNGGGAVNVSGGSLIVDGEFNMGGLRGAAPINVNVSGGFIQIKDVFRLPGCASRGGNIRLNLYGGVVDTNSLVHGGTDEGAGGYTDDWRIDIEQGEMRIWSDVRDEIDANVAAGQITAYDGEGTMVVELVDGNTVVTALPPSPHTARYPYPGIGATKVELDVILGWTPGDSATNHDVFIGTDLEDVNTATPGSHPGVEYANVVMDVNFYDPCDACDLEYATIYYWRVDANNGGTYEGRIWHFKTKSAILDPNLWLWCKLDEPNGTTAYDSSGREYNGSVDGPEELWDPDGGRYGGARIFDDDGDADTVIEFPPDATKSINSGVTVTLWLKDITVGNDGSWIFGAGKGGGNAPYLMQAAIPSEEGTDDVYWRAGNDSNDVLSWTPEGGVTNLKGWHHWAFVKDENADTISIYFDGLLADSNTGTSDTIAEIKNSTFKIGAAAWSENYCYSGVMDDVRMYDYGLSAEEIAEIFRGGKLELAWAPEPLNGQIDVPRDANLIWKPGNKAVSHDIYFGTSFKDVNDANTTSDVYIGRFDFDANEYEPDVPGGPNVLVLEKTYYWRIDEVNDFDPNIWKGDVWSFTVANFLVIDGFESYGATSNFITDTWIDGGGGMSGNLSGCLLNIGMAKWNNPVHTGDKSMDYGYNCDAFDWIHFESVYYSEAELPFDSPQDWTEAGVKMLTLFFYGKSDNDVNDTEQMYVAVKDSNDNCAEIRYGDAGEDMNDIKLEEWQEWNIAMPDFHDANQVDANYVTNLYIGFGYKDGEVAGGSGKVYFDDIRLYLSKCVPAYGPQYDFSDNCIVDYDDIAIMADQWLRTDACLPVLAPTVGPVARYEFEDGAGSTVTESINGGFYNGTAEGNYSWVAGKLGSSAMDFTGGWVSVPDDGNTPLLAPTDEVTVAAWINLFESTGKFLHIIAKGGDDKETYSLEINDDSGGLTFFVRDDPNATTMSVNSENPMPMNEWIHIAGKYDGNNVTSYVNGQLELTGDVGAFQLFVDSNDGLGIGGRWNDTGGRFSGSIDGIQIYDYALSAEEVAYIATAPSHNGYVPLITEVNIYDEEPAEQKAVNFRDLAKLLNKWLYKKYWP